MIDHIKFKTSPARSSAALIKTATVHPLHLETRRVCSSSHKGEVITIDFGIGTRCYASFEFLQTASGDIRLQSVEGSLANLVHGHNGKLIKSQREMDLGLTRLRILVASLILDSDFHLLLPSIHPDNHGFIESIEIPIQVSDPKRALFRAANSSCVAQSQRPPTFVAGQSVTLGGPGVDWKIYDMQAQLNPVRRIVPGSFTCTRIECHIRSGIEMAKSTGVSRPNAHLPAAVSFDLLWVMLHRTINRNLRGGLADPQAAPADLRTGAKCVLEGSHEPLSLHNSLSLETAFYGDQECKRIRHQVFDHLARKFPVSLKSTLGDTFPYPLLKEIERPAEEAEHQGHVAALSWATQPDRDISGTFSGGLYLKSWDLSRRIFLSNES